MINIDIVTGALEDAIFGGPRPSEESIRDFLAKAEIGLPASVIATGEDETGPPNAAALRIHPGLVYWFLPVSKRQHRTSICNQPNELIGVIQKAILLHRRQELCMGKETATSELAEAQAFHLALGEVRNPSEHKTELLDQWMQVLMIRHQTRIHEVRRRLFEFLGALTRGIEAPLGYPFYSATRQINEIFRLPELVRRFRRICGEFRGLIAGRDSFYTVGTERSEAVQKAFHFMEANFTSPIGLREAASAAHVSAPHLARIFRQETGRTVVAYLHALRITKARELLATTEMTTLEIAFESGFESVEHFYRLFRKLTGTTPRNYRITRRS